MHPSNINPFSYSPDRTIPYRPSLFDINPNSNQQDQNPLSSSFFYSPSPYIHYEDDQGFLHLHDLMFTNHQQQQQPPDPQTPEASAPDSNKSDDHEIDRHKKSTSTLLPDQLPRKRTCKKDRHSKIETAQGMRDRRMRLSLEVARKFFSLQDMLGFDKASKTVEWLLNKSKSAIQEVKGGFPRMKNSCSVGTTNNCSASSTSECEVVSGMDEYSAVDGNRRLRKGKGSKSSPGEDKRSNERGISRKPAFRAPRARESRDKARERARERTRDKQRIVESKLPLEVTNHRDMNRFESWRAFENGQESGTRLDLLPDVEELRSPMIFNHNSGISQENQFADFSSLWQNMGGLHQYKSRLP